MFISIAKTNINLKISTFDHIKAIFGGQNIWWFCFSNNLKNTIQNETPCILVKGASENRRNVKCDFSVVRIGRFTHSDVFGRRKYARLGGLSLKSYEMNIQSVSCLKTQIQFETFAKK